MDLVFSFVLFCLSLFVTFFVFRFVSHNNVSKWKSERMRKKVELTCTRTYAQFKFFIIISIAPFLCAYTLINKFNKNIPIKKRKKKRKKCAVFIRLFCLVVIVLLFNSFFSLLFLLRFPWFSSVELCIFQFVRIEVAWTWHNDWEGWVFDLIDRK